MSLISFTKLLHLLTDIMPPLIDEVNNLAVLQSYIKKLQNKSEACKENNMAAISIRDKSEYLVFLIKLKIKELQQNTINGSYLEKYIYEVRTLQIKTIIDPITNIKYWDLSDYNQYTNKHKLLLEAIQYKAHHELSKFTDKEFRVLIARLEVIQQQFNKLFKAVNSNKYLENAPDNDFLPLMISTLITIFEHEGGLVTISFTQDLMNAIKLKNTSIKSLIDRAKSSLRHNLPGDNHVSYSVNSSCEFIYLLPLTNFPVYIGDNRAKTFYALEDILIHTKNNIPELKRSVQEWFGKHEYKDLFLSYMRLFVYNKIAEAGDLLNKNDKDQFDILNSFIDANDQSLINKKIVQNSSKIESLLSYL